MDTQNIKAIELVIFKAKPGFSLDKVKTSLLSLNPILESYKGFISRKLALSKENQWMDLVYWESMEDATFAADDVMKNENAIKAFEVIDKQEMSFFHFDPISED